MTRAFRYVEDVEWADIVECGTLRPGQNAYLIDNLDHIGPAFYVDGADIAQMQIVGAVEGK